MAELVVSKELVDFVASTLREATAAIGSIQAEFDAKPDLRFTFGKGPNIMSARRTILEFVAYVKTELDILSKEQEFGIVSEKSVRNQKRHGDK